MPLIREADGKFRWEVPSQKDVADFNKEVGNQGDAATLPLTYELKQKLDQALKTLAPRGGVDAMADTNRRLYSSLKNILGQPAGTVDIIVPVHNAIHIARKCVQRVLDRTQWPFHLWIVDDASDEFTHDELWAFAEENKKHVSLITNQRNKGFAASVNRGIKAGSGEYVCLLNSDVFVTDMWLTKMIMALKADPKNMIVCPATNNTAIVDVPLSPGASYLQMNQIFEAFAQRRYPELMPTGFCFLFPRVLLNKIGYFDESYQNFGEETDFWWKTLRYTEGSDYKRFRAVLADDTYVFHERGTSYSQLGNDTHMHFRKLASSRFNKLWPEWTTWKNSYDVGKAVGGLREKIPATLLRGPKDRYRICWVVHDATLCGGMKYIADVVNELVENGVNAKVAVIKRDQNRPEAYIGELTSAPIFFNSREEFIKDFPSRVFPGGILVAATVELAPVVQMIGELSEGRIRPMLHAQSYEPDILTDPTDKETARSLFQRIPDVISNAHWVTKALENECQVKPAATIHPGLDLHLFYRRNRSAGDERSTVLISMNPSMPCKGFDRGLALIAALENRAQDMNLDIRVLVYGVESLNQISNAICLGALPQMRVATLLGTEADVFVDPSYLHSYGMPALEAAASGCKVFSWDNKGISEYADGIAAHVVPNETPPDVLAERILDYLTSPEQVNAHRDRYPHFRQFLDKYHNREKSIDTFIKRVEKLFNLNFISRKITVVVPHLRKHGGPTTMLVIANELAAVGHRVKIATVYPDVNPEVVGMTNLPVNVNVTQLEPSDLFITNSDNPLVDQIAALPRTKKIMLKLSHNPRFKAEEEKGLQQKWDAIVTSSDWLKEVCEKPTEGWNYLRCEAHRIGWWNYAFSTFQCPPSSRVYHPGTEEQPIVIATLIHAHPLKGTREAIDAMGELSLKYGARVRFIGVGEVPPQAFRSNLPNFEYRFSMNRDRMAATLQETDIWLGASHSEGLGRMALEAMSAGAAVVTTNTAAEYARDGENCIIVPVGDSSAMVQAIERLIEDEALASHLRACGFDTAASLADPVPCINELQKVISSVFA